MNGPVVIIPIKGTFCGQQTRQWHHSLGVTLDEGPEVVCQAKESMQLRHIFGFRPILHCCNLWIKMKPCFRDNMLQVQQLKLIQATLRKLSIKLMLPENAQNFP